MQDTIITSHQRIVMATLRAEWPNEARRYEKIKNNIESLRTQCQLLSMAVTDSIRELNPAYGKENISVKPHRPRRKQTVHFKGTSHPVRKGKHTNGA